jgi:hypothetical protein
MQSLATMMDCVSLPRSLQRNFLCKRPVNHPAHAPIGLKRLYCHLDRGLFWRGGQISFLGGASSSFSQQLLSLAANAGASVLVDTI